jgi:tetratricopeptide (TPR) repeat protein
VDAAKSTAEWPAMVSRAKYKMRRFDTGANDTIPFLEEGEKQLAAGDWDGAAATFERAIQAAPHSAIAHSRLGIAYAHRQQWQEAIAAFSKAVQLDPLYAPAYSNLGNVYKEQGRLDEAIAYYKKAISIDPDYWIAHQNLGIVYKQQGRIGEAVREFKTATRLSLRAPAGLKSPPHSELPRRAGCLPATGFVALFLALLGMVIGSR